MLSPSIHDVCYLPSVEQQAIWYSLPLYEINYVCYLPLYEINYVCYLPLLMMCYLPSVEQPAIW